MIRNPYRTYVVGWGEIEKVERSSIAAWNGNPRPAIALRLTSGKRVTALAVPRHTYEQDDVVRQLLSLAPRPVALRSESPA